MVVYRRTRVYCCNDMCLYYNLYTIEMRHHHHASLVQNYKYHNIGCMMQKYELYGMYNAPINLIGTVWRVIGHCRVVSYDNENKCRYSVYAW